MKKVIALILLLSVCVLPLVSCLDQNDKADNTHKECTEHTWSQYYFDNNTHWREYTCGCSCPKNLDNHIDTNNDNTCDICSYKYYCDEHNQYFSEKYPWILDITASEVTEIQMTHHIMNSELGSFDNVYSLFDKESIADFINQCRSLTMYEIGGFEPLPNSPKYFYKIILNDKTEYTFYIYCGFLDGSWGLKYQPTITKYPTAEHAYSFVLYLTFGQVYEYNNSSQKICCLNNTDELEFVLLDSSKAPKNEPTHLLKLNYTTLYILNESTFYYFNEQDEQIYCRLTHGNFYQMFDEFSIPYQILVNTFLEKHPELTTSTVDKYFGITETGAIMALISSPELQNFNQSDDMQWIDGTPIRNYSQVFVLYQNEFYSVGSAYRNGIITKNDVRTIYLMQQK